MTTPEIIEKLRKKLDACQEYLYWDCNDRLERSSYDDIVEKGTVTWLDELREYNWEACEDAADAARLHIVEDHRDDLCEALGVKDDDFDAQVVIDDWLSDNRVCVDIDPRDVFRNAVLPCRIVLYSNYDCMNSHWFSQGHYYWPESYFADALKALRLCPWSVRELLKQHSIELHGNVRKHRRDSGLVALDKGFITELTNTTSGANLLTIPAGIELTELHDKVEGGKIANIKVVKVRKGSKMGFFDSTYGGGSLLELVLRRDTVIKLDVPRGSPYTRWALEYDERYSINDVYGCGPGIYNDIEIIR